MSSRKKSTRKSGASFSSILQSRPITFPSKEVPLRITQASSGTGGLTSVTSSGSYSAATTVPIDPFNMGGRIQEVASLFSLYRVKSLHIAYVPDNTSSGVGETVAGTTTTPSYGSRAFAWGISRDPALSNLSYSQILQLGGSFGNTASPHGLRYRDVGNQWYFTSTTSASPSTIDARMVAPLQLKFAYFNTSTTAAASYGHLIFDIVIELKGSLPNSTPLGLSLTPSTESESKSQDSDDLKAAALVTQNKTKTSWF